MGNRRLLAKPKVKQNMANSICFASSSRSIQWPLYNCLAWASSACQDYLPSHTSSATKTE